MDKSILLQSPTLLIEQAKLVLGTEFQNSLLALKKDCLVVVGDADTIVDSGETLEKFKSLPNVKIEKIASPSEIKRTQLPFVKKLVHKFKKDKIVEEITFGSHDCYMEVGEKILEIFKNFTNNYS